MTRERVEVRISGVSEARWRRWQRRAGKGSAGIPWFTWVVVLALFVWLVPESVPEATVDVGGKTILGRGMRLIQDKSGSMGAQESLVQERLAALRAAGMYSEVACELSNTEFPDFVACVERLASEESEAGVYVFGDFQWQFSDAGLERVRRSLEGRGIRVYLETIGNEPPDALVRLAERSGGEMIRTKPR
jgi:hypothetical protein